MAQSYQTGATFDSLLKEYLPYDLLVEEIIKRDFLLSNVKKDNSWKGGVLKVPFMKSSASSMAFGRLPGFVGDAGAAVTAGTNIREDEAVIAQIAAPKELWGAMIFNDRDLQSHDSLEQSFLKILPDRINSFVNGMREALSQSLLVGGHVDIASAVANGNHSGDPVVNPLFTVSFPERFRIGQMIQVNNKGGALKTFYVKAIDMAASQLSVTDKFDLSNIDAELDLDGGGTATNEIEDDTKIYIENGAADASNRFASLNDQLALAANGGSDTIFDQDKSSAPFLQAHQDTTGGGIVANNTVLAKLLDVQTAVRRIGKGNPTDCIMSYATYAAALKELTLDTTYTSDSGKASRYGWSEVVVHGPKGQIKLVGVPEMDDDRAFILDWNALKLHSNGMIERRTAPDGKQFYETREQSGFKYIVDHRFFGELVVHNPSYCGVLTSIS